MQANRKASWCVRLAMAVATGLLLLTAGCAGTKGDTILRDRATLCLHRGMRYPENPAVRAEAMESAGEVLGERAVEQLKEGLGDEHPGVRFAAAMALGQVANPNTFEAVRKLVDDLDPSVRVAAYYAVERMGSFQYRRAWVDALHHPSESVRRNAVMALGLLGEAKTRPLLVRVAAEDSDEGVRLQAVEALVLIGDEEAESKFVRDAFGGMGYRQPFALLALGHIQSPQSITILQSRLANAPYLEARLAAARGLAMHGLADGFPLALQSLNWNQPQANQPDDPPENQIMRVRTMAAMALGESHDRRALPALQNCMETANDPRIQVAAARAILMILNNSQSASQPG